MALTLQILAAGQLGGTSDTVIYPSGGTTVAGKSALIKNVVLYNRGGSAVTAELTVRRQNATIGSQGRGAYIFKDSVGAGQTKEVSIEVGLLLNTGPDGLWLKGTTDIEYIVNGLERDI